MTVNTAPFSKGLKTAQTQLVSFEQGIARSGHMIRNLFAGALFAGAAAGIYKLVTAGSDLVESQNKIKEIFGESSELIIKSSEQMQKAFGVSKVEFQDAAGTIGAILQGVGYASEDAAKLAVHFSKLAVDVASFFNIPVDQALLKIKAGLTGESEPLKALGVLIDEQTVKNYAYTHSIAKVGAELTQAQKVQSRVAIITAGLSKAQGDVARTADEVANASRGVTGRIEALAETIGTQLQPIAKAVLGEMSSALTVLNSMWGENAVSASKSSELTVAGLGYVQGAIGKVADAWQYVEIGLLGLSANVTPVITVLIDVVGFLARAIDKVAEVTGLGAIGIGEFFTKMAEGLEKATAETQKLFDSKLADLMAGKTPSVEINLSFQKAQADLARIRADAMKPVGDINKLAPKGEDVLKKPAKLKEMKFADAMERGTSESTNTILRSKYGGGRSGKELEKIAKNGEEANKHLAKIAGAAAPTIGKTADYEVWRDFG